MRSVISRMDSLMLRSAESGDRLSQINLAVMHDNRRRSTDRSSIPQDPEALAVHDAQSLKWWTRAAGQGSGKAHASLALRYESGDGVAQDLVEALMWYLIAETHLRGDDAERTMQTRRRLSRRMDPAAVRRAERRAGQWRPQVEAAAQVAS